MIASPTPATTNRWPAWVCPIVALSVPLIVIVGFLGDAPASLLWDSDSYFITARLFSDQFPYVPTLNFRAFGYPAFLKLFQSGDRFDIDAILAAQKALFVASAGLVYWIAMRITHRHALGLIAALLYALNFRIMLLANSIMTETVAVFLELIFFAIVVEFMLNRRARWLLGAATLVLAVSVFVRPTFVAALPVLMLAPWLATGKRASPISFRLLLSTAVAIVVVSPILAYSAYNYYRVGHFKAFQASGFASLNYTTNACFFQKLSDNVAYVRDPLTAFQRAHFPELNNIADNGDGRCKSWSWPYTRPSQVNWGNTYEFLKKSFHQRYPGTEHMEWDTLAMRITLDAIRDRPLEYLRIWTQVFTEFWTTYSHVDGYYATVRDIEQRRPLLHGHIDQWAKQIERINGFIVWLSLPAILIAIATAFMSQESGNARWAILLVALYCLGYSLLSTSLEAGTQSRYRVPLDPLVCVCVAFVLSGLMRFASRIKAGPPRQSDNWLIRPRAVR